MERNDVLKIMAVLRGAYPQFYRNISRQEAEDTVNLWLDMFRQDDSQIVAAAVKSVIEGDEKGFPPTIGQVKAKMRLITDANDMTEADAWQLVAKAIRNGIYGAQEEFEKFPPIIRRIVGSPNMLREWARMDTETVHSVVSSNFQRSYRAISAKEREYAKLPTDVKALVESLQGTRPMELEKPHEPPELPEPKRIPTPAWLLKKVPEVPTRSKGEVLKYLRGEMGGK